MTVSRILCVDEDRPSLEQLRVALQSAGYEAIPTSDGEEALRLLATEEVDGVVLSYNMAAADGRSLRNTIRHFYPETPMLLFSAIEELTQMPLEVFRAYLAHPGPPAAVLTAIG